MWRGWYNTKKWAFEGTQLSNMVKMEVEASQVGGGIY
jgi:hypothetical protein